MCAPQVRMLSAQPSLTIDNGSLPNDSARLQADFIANEQAFAEAPLKRFQKRIE